MKNRNNSNILTKINRKSLTYRLTFNKKPLKWIGILDEKIWIKKYEK